MPKLYTSNYPSSGYASEALMRSELQKIEDAFEDVVPRIQNIDSPQLQADIDMNNYDLLNVKNIDVQGLTVDGGTLQDEIEAGAQSVISEVEDRVTDAQVAAGAAQLARNVAEGYADDTAQLHEEVEIFRDESQANAESVQSNLDSFNSIWHGVQGTEPTKEEANVGSLYFNDSDSQTYVCYAAAYLFGEIQQLYWRPLSVDENSLGTAAFENIATEQQAKDPSDFSSVITAGRLHQALDTVLEKPLVQWTSIETLGSVSKFFSGTTSSEYYYGMARLGKEKAVVHSIDYGTSNELVLTPIELIDNQWIVLGTKYSFGASHYVEITELTDTDLAVYSFSDEELYTLRYESGSWSVVGNPLSVPIPSNEDLEENWMTAMSPTRIAKIRGETDLQMYEFDGTNWSAVGNPHTLSINGFPPYKPKLTSLSDNRLVIYACNNVLVTYDFDGTDWSKVGNELLFSPASYAVMVEAINSTDVVAASTRDNLIKVYRFDGTDWNAVSRSKGFNLANGGEFLRSFCLSGNEFTMFNTQINGLQNYRINFAPLPQPI